MLVGAFLHQVFDGLGACAAVSPVAELPGVGAKPASEVAARFIHVRVGLLAADGQRLYGSACALFGDIAGIRDRAFKLLAALSRKHFHDLSAMASISRRA